MEIKKDKIFIYILKILAFFCFTLYIVSFNLYVLMDNYFFKDAQNIVEKTNLNYDFYISKNKLKELDININKILEKYKIKKYAYLKIDPSNLAIKEETKNADSFTANVISLKDNDLNLLNTNTFEKEKLNIEEKIAKKYNISDGEKIIIKKNKLKDLNGKTNTKFNLKHPLFINTPSIFVNDEKISSKNSNIIYISLNEKDKSKKEEKIKEIEKSLKLLDPSINIHINNHDLAINIKPNLKKATLIQLIVFFIAYIFIQSLFNAFIKKQIKNNNIDLNKRKLEKNNNKITNKILKTLLKIFEILILAYLSKEVFDVIAKQYLFNLNIFIEKEKSQLYLSIILTAIIIIINDLINNYIMKNLHNTKK